ncbi:hypothetical protein J1605_012644 [Eschrichtius robustus]|uniref:Uncharacterized protein n=1 Tax=Eschrichtius robustus TaxID=9764 RepID=A0AB34GLM4_ESCRO|nr:hypothetical protein J1605_012644 [Eschrichtius robustus]
MSSAHAHQGSPRPLPAPGAPTPSLSAAPPRRLPVTCLGAGNGKLGGVRRVQFAMGLFGKTPEKPPKELGAEGRVKTSSASAPGAEAAAPALPLEPLPRRALVRPARNLSLAQAPPADSWRTSPGSERGTRRTPSPRRDGPGARRPFPTNCAVLRGRLWISFPCPPTFC